MDSEIKGVSVRAILAMGTTFSGLFFLYVMAVISIVAIGGEAITTIGLVIIAAVIGFINLALGYYLGQKTANVANRAGDLEVSTESSFSDDVNGEPTG